MAIINGAKHDEAKKKKEYREIQVELLGEKRELLLTTLKTIVKKKEKNPGTDVRQKIKPNK
jgi:hypothetical protein